MPMITVYRNVKSKTEYRYIYNEEIIDKNDMSSRFAPFFKSKVVQPSAKQAEYQK
jgi:hypothetical protein